MSKLLRGRAERELFTEWANRHIWIHGCDLATEWLQAGEEGRDLGPVKAEFTRLRRGEKKAGYFETMLTAPRDHLWLERSLALIDRVQTLPLDPVLTRAEPDDLAAIRRLRGEGPAVPRWKGGGAAFAERVRGGFLARTAACMLGKPFEGVDRRTIRIIAEETGNWPLRRFQRAPTAAQLRRVIARRPARLPNAWQQASYIDRCDGFPGDDDINYTVVGMEVMSDHGTDFTPADVASVWLQQLPLLATCTAERVAYRNLGLGWPPPVSARIRNPFREWIGAQIRADFFGYAAPGNPARAAEWAWRDASVSHVRNGIYGEMWVAAMLAAAFVLGDWEAVVRAGLAQVPAGSRLHAGVSRVLAAHRRGEPFEEILDGIHRERDEFTPHGWCHTIPNAQIVAASLLPGGGFAEVIARAASAGFDTDCNAATCGSLWGVRHGERAIPRGWLRPLRNRLRTSLVKHAETTLDAMADRMAVTAGRFL
jgi:ADP-ribosylglycohydrolase